MYLQVLVIFCCCVINNFCSSYPDPRGSGRASGGGLDLPHSSELEYRNYPPPYLNGVGAYNNLHPSQAAIQGSGLPYHSDHPMPKTRKPKHRHGKRHRVTQERKVKKPKRRRNKKRRKEKVEIPEDLKQPGVPPIKNPDLGFIEELIPQGTDVPAIEKQKPIEIEDLKTGGQNSKIENPLQPDQGTDFPEDPNQGNLFPKEPELGNRLPDDLNQGNLFPKDPNQGNLFPKEPELGNRLPDDLNQGNLFPKDPNQGNLFPKEPELGNRLPDDLNQGNLFPENPNQGNLFPKEPELGNRLPDDLNQGNLFPENPNQGNLFPEEPELGNRLPDDLNQGNLFPENPHQGNLFPEVPELGNRLPNDLNQGNFFPENPNQGNLLPEEPELGNRLPNDLNQGNLFPENPNQGNLFPEGPELGNRLPDDLNQGNRFQEYHNHGNRFPDIDWEINKRRNHTSVDRNPQERLCPNLEAQSVDWNPGQRLCPNLETQTVELPHPEIGISPDRNNNNAIDCIKNVNQGFGEPKDPEWPAIQPPVPDDCMEGNNLIACNDQLIAPNLGGSELQNPDEQIPEPEPDGTTKKPFSLHEFGHKVVHGLFGGGIHKSAQLKVPGLYLESHSDLGDGHLYRTQKSFDAGLVKGNLGIQLF